MSLQLVPGTNGTGGLHLSAVIAGAWRMASWNWDAAARLRWNEGCVALGVTALGALALSHGVSVASLANAWILGHPARPLPITGSSRIEAVAEAVAALAIRLDAEEWYRVWSASAGHDVP